MTDRLSMSQVLEIILPIMVDAVGAAGVRMISQRTQNRMGDGGTPGEWLRAMGLEIAELDDPIAERAFIRALDAVQAS